MTKKVKILLISLGGALVVGGGLGVGLGIGLNQKNDPTPPKPIYDVDPCPEGTHIDTNMDGFCDVCNYPVEIKHSTSISGDPSAPFYLKVGEEKTIKAVLSPSPQRAQEKTFQWKNSNVSVANFVNKTTDAKQTILGLKEGEVKFTATNEYNTELVRDFHANVIDYDEDNMYLWEFESKDREKFGYVNETGKKAGNTTGTARLGTLDWEFYRSAANSLQSNKGGIGFGKGENPEQVVRLTSRNDRAIKKIVIETASAKALANITVKIGDNEVINKKTPSFSDEFIGSVSYVDSSSSPNKYNGDISIQFDTPEFDPAKAESDLNYKAPGAVYLKSIWIEYYEIELDWKTVKTYDLEAKFLAGEEDPDFSVLTGSAKAITINDEEAGIQIKFNKIMKPSSDGSGVQGLAITNGDIEVISTKSDEVLKSVTFDYKNGSTRPTYGEYSSVYGGEPYLDLIDSKKGAAQATTHVGKFLKEDNVNAVKFVNEGTSTHYKVGALSITVKTIAGSHLELDQLSLAEGAELNKTSYKEGEVFDPAGLRNIVASFKNASEPMLIPADRFTYYDAQKYDEDGTLETYLHEGTTEVIIFLKGVELRISGFEVILQKLNFVKVTSLDQIDATSRYLVTCPENHAFALGSAGSKMGDSAGSMSDSKLDFGDTLFIPDVYENDLIKVEINQSTNQYTFVNYDGEHTWGLTASLATSASYKSAAFKDWNIELADDEDATKGALKITMQVEDKEGEEKEAFLYHSGTAFKPGVVSSKKSVVSNIVLYKLLVE